MSRVVAAAIVIALVAVVVWRLAGGTSTEAVPVLAAAGDGEIGTAATATAPTPEPIPVLRPLPALVDIDGWMNTDATTLGEHLDTVTVIQFWTFGCSNCKATLENLRNLYATYGDRGLEIVGIHAPEFDYEADPDNIARALVDLGVTWPVALDTDLKNFRSWQEGPRNFWPRTYVVDAEGNIRFDHIGEGKYAELNTTVERLLADAG